MTCPFPAEAGIQSRAMTLDPGPIDAACGVAQDMLRRGEAGDNEASVARRPWVEKRPGQMPAPGLSFILRIAFIGEEAWAGAAGRTEFGGFPWR